MGTDNIRTSISPNTNGEIAFMHSEYNCAITNAKIMPAILSIMSAKQCFIATDSLVHLKFGRLRFKNNPNIAEQSTYAALIITEIITIESSDLKTNARHIVKNSTAGKVKTIWSSNFAPKIFLASIGRDFKIHIFLPSSEIDGAVIGFKDAITVGTKYITSAMYGLTNS